MVSPQGRARPAAARSPLLFLATAALAACSGGSSSPAVPPSASQSSVSVTPAVGLVADGASSALITITVRDGSGTPLAGREVALAISGTQNTLDVADDETDASGVVLATLTTFTAETKTVSALVGVGPAQVAILEQPTVEFDADASNLSAAFSSATATPGGGLLADGLETANVTVTVRDAHGNLVENQTVAIASDGSGNVIAQSSTPTDAAGVAIATIASTTAELKSLTVTINPGPSQVVVDDAPVVEFVASATDVSVVLSSAIATPDTGVIADASDTSTIIVTVRDASGDPVAGETVEIAASGSSNAIVQPASPTDANGVATATIATTVAETKTITVTLNPGPSQLVLVDEPTVEFQGDPSSVNSGFSSIDVDPTFGLRANGADESEITVTVRDANGNPVPGVNVTLAATGRNNALEQPAASTNSAGEATGFLSTMTAETKTVSATAGAVALVDTPSITFVWFPPHERYVRTSGSDANSGESPADAWRTIGMAASSVVPGDVVYVGAGTYEESVLITTDGALDEPIAFIADSGGEKTSDAGDVVVDSLGAESTIQIDGADDILIEGFVIVGAQDGEGAGVRVGPAPTQRVKIRRNRIHSNGIAIAAVDAVDLLLENNRISRQRRGVASGATAAGASFAGGVPVGGHGIVLDATSAASVSNNLVYVNEGDGVVVTGGSIGATLRSNTLYANEGDQVRIDGLFNIVELRDNVFSQGLADGIELALGSTAISTFNLSWGHFGLDWLGLPLGSGDQSADPGFADADGENGAVGGADGDDDRFEFDVFGSPAFDAGSSLALESLLGNGSALADMTTRMDGVLDGTAPDGALANVGFHYEAHTGELDPLDGGDARIAFAPLGDRQTRLSQFYGVTTSVGSPIPLPPVGTTVRWIEHALSPLDDGEELAAIAWQSALTSGIELQRWSGGAWHTDAETSGLALANGDKRGFALAYEDSGDALFVRSDGTGNPKFRARHHGEWSDEAAIFTLPPSVAAVQWIELATRTGSDEMTLVYADALSALRAVVWNGSAWETADATTLELFLRTTSTRAFDVAYEEQSGDALVIWAGLLNVAKYARRAAGSDTWTTTSNIAGLGPTPAYYDLAQERGTNRIAMAGLEDGPAGREPKCAIWTGSAWSSVALLETGSNVSLGATSGDLGIAAGWVGTSGKAVVVYADDQSGRIDFGTWTSGAGWSLATDVAVAGKGTTESVRLASFPDRNELIAAISDSNGDLFIATYDGVAWTLANAGFAIESNLSSIDGAPFDIEPRGD